MVIQLSISGLHLLLMVILRWSPLDNVIIKGAE